MTTTLITGANKGIGHETARRLIERSHTVYIGARDSERGKAAAAGLGGRFVQIGRTALVIHSVLEVNGYPHVGFRDSGGIDSRTSARLFQKEQR